MVTVVNADTDVCKSHRVITCVAKEQGTCEIFGLNVLGVAIHLLLNGVLYEQ